MPAVSGDLRGARSTQRQGLGCPGDGVPQADVAAVRRDLVSHQRPVCADRQELTCNRDLLGYAGDDVTGVESNAARECDMTAIVRQTHPEKAERGGDGLSSVVDRSEPGRGRRKVADVTERAVVPGRADGRV